MKKEEDSARIGNATIPVLPNVDELTALTASFHFLGNNPDVHNQIRDLIATRAVDIMSELEEDLQTRTFLVSKRNIHAIFAKAVHETLGLVLLGNDAAVASETLQRQFDASGTESANTLSGAPELQVE